MDQLVDTMNILQSLPLYPGSMGLLDSFREGLTMGWQLRLVRSGPDIPGYVTWLLILAGLIVSSIGLYLAVWTRKLVFPTGTQVQFRYYGRGLGRFIVSPIIHVARVFFARLPTPIQFLTLRSVGVVILVLGIMLMCGIVPQDVNEHTRAVGKPLFEP